MGEEALRLREMTDLEVFLISISCCCVCCVDTSRDAVCAENS